MLSSSEVLNLVQDMEEEYGGVRLVPENDERLKRTRLMWHSVKKQETEKPRRKSNIDEDQVQALYLSGYSVADIAKKLQRRSNSVQKLVARLRGRGKLPKGKRFAEWVATRDGVTVKGDMGYVSHELHFDERKARLGRSPGLSLKKTGLYCYKHDYSNQ